MASVGDAIEVYWPDDKEYYAGKVVAYHPSTGTSSILYDDGEMEDINLTFERWRYIEGLLGSSSQCSEDPNQVSSLNTTLKSNNPTKSLMSSKGHSKSTIKAAGKVRVISKKSVSDKRKRTTKPSLAKVVPAADQSLPEITQPTTVGLVERLIGYTIETWLRSETRREHSTSMFSLSHCLHHAENVLTSAIADSLYAAALKRRSAGRCLNWVVTGIADDDRRSHYRSWNNPLTDEEWVMEKRLFADISDLVIRSRDRTIKNKYQRDNPLVRALGLLFCASDLLRTSPNR